MLRTKIKFFIKQSLLRCLRLLRVDMISEKNYSSEIEYWEDRAREYGIRSVLNRGHSEEEIVSVTRMQKAELFPVLKNFLKGEEKYILDFGCGPGRFTCDLASIIDGKAIGVDPIEFLLDLAPNNENVEYRLMERGIIPVEDSSIDIVWICLVLGGIIDEDALIKTISEINRVLKNNGLLFLAENTSEKTDGKYWKFRSIETYQQLFDFTDLKYVSHYFDLNEQISVMVGKKCIKN